MYPDMPVGRVMTIDEAMTFWTRVKEAEDTMGKLTRDERLAILGTVGQEITTSELTDLLAGKRVLIIKDKSNESNA